MDTTTTTSRGRDVAYQLHPFTNLGRHESEGPLVITRGKGVYVYDESGREYLEALAGLWCTELGFGEERLAEAASQQLRRLGLQDGDRRQREFDWKLTRLIDEFNQVLRSARETRPVGADAVDAHGRSLTTGSFGNFGNTT